jgi:23S rRNA (adenine2503-C2)-methyltransferase
VATGTQLLDLTLRELEQELVSMGEPSYRATQVWEWLYRSLVTSFDEMTNLPKALRRRLRDRWRCEALREVTSASADDGRTQKTLLAADDGARIETVLMAYDERNTVCVSSQVGCAVGCPFCATGATGLVRNLTAGEIVAQVLHAARALARQGGSLTNVVYMGMGEPLLNYDAVWRATMNLHHPAGLNMGTRRFTVSTIGVVPGILQLAQEEGEVGLAVSLHAPDDALRDQLVPMNKRYPISAVLEAARSYSQQTGRRVTFEYALIAGVNDAPAQAQATATLLRGTLCHVNLIPLNPVPNSPMVAPGADVVTRFRDVLLAWGIPTTVRDSRGAEIAAGCGQLRAAHETQP